MSHFSIDLETLDNIPASVILSVGIAKFDIKTGEILDKWLWKLDKDTQRHRTRGKDTMEWWSKQSEEAKKEAFSGDIYIGLCATELNHILSEETKPMMWGNGANFDVAILDNMYSYQAPWDFWNVRDMRTLVWMAEVIGFDKELIKREGTHHSAIDDAVHQAKVISKAYQQIKGLYNAYKALKNE